MEPQTPVGEIGERALIRHLRSRIPSGPGVIVGVGDDAAAVETGPLTLVTSDTLVEGIHFRREWSPPRLLGRKALSVNLSDVAAMAGLARYATVSLCLPPDIPLAFVDGLYDGLLERAAEIINATGSLWCQAEVARLQAQYSARDPEKSPGYTASERQRGSPRQHPERGSGLAR